MSEKALQQEIEVASHIAHTIKKQKQINADSHFVSPILFSPVPQVPGIVQPIFNVSLTFLETPSRHAQGYAS